MHDIQVLKTTKPFFGVGYEVVLDGEVRLTCYGPNAKANAAKEAAKTAARLSHQPDPQ